jgi:NAD(P)-dependent dehydrogenase (short-subunit alcohol dehydrogenase family)
MGRLGTPADVGNAVALICSEEADWITGQLIEAAGGCRVQESDQHQMRYHCWLN